ncbi:MAG: response regulator transcription factor [Planctomycetota bacterium]|nr:response regulator transcription factor [Planctomycetota bacterium]
MSRATILVVEDDTAIRRGLVDALTFAGYAALEAADGPSAASLAIESPIDLVLLDVMLPGMDGFGVLDEIRKAQPTLPVIMVTARGAEGDRVKALTDGADDYVVKPFSAKELLARVEAVLRRSPERPGDVQTLRAHGMTIHLERREVAFEDGEIHQLSEREAGILRYLASNRDRAVDRDELLHRVWGLNPHGIHTRTVDMHIARLREKLTNGISGSDTQSIIVTVRAKGYMLADQVETASK